MKKFKLKYWYLASGMEGIPQEYPEKIINADSRDEALYKYHTSNGIDFKSFEEFTKKEQYIKECATTCQEITNEKN